MFLCFWVAIYERWQAGQSARQIAKVFDISERKIALRCGWIDQHFPPGAPARLMTHFTRELDEARKVLDAGEGVDAERRAKAILALVKAARALEDWSMDKSKIADSATSSHEAAYDPKAELERRLLEYAERERKAELARRAYARSSRGDDLALGDMGKTQSNRSE